MLNGWPKGTESSWYTPGSGTLGCQGSGGAPESPGSMSILINLQVQAVPQWLRLRVHVLDDLAWSSQPSAGCKGWPQWGLGLLIGVYDIRC